MKSGPAGSFGTQLKALREAAGFTQEELATIASLSVHAVSALERGERRRPHPETVRALTAALDLTGAARDALVESARAPAHRTTTDALSGAALPLALTTLLGREADVQALRQWLSDPAARLITLVGPGGVGKTRVALEIARVTSAEGGSRVVFVPLAAARNPAFVASAIAEAFGWSDVSASDLPSRARVACADHATLLVLDNFEHVPEAAPLVAGLLTSVASLQVLVTSRAPLRVRGEREYAIGPLALDEPEESPLGAPAVRLFVERVRDVQPEFRVTPANLETVTAICRRLDALPLALELAAPWIKVLTAEGLLRRLEHDVLLSHAGPRDLPERQQTMNATVAWSYQLLDAEEQRAFRRLGALPGPFPIEAAAAVLAGRDGALSGSDLALTATASLIDKSLLVRTDSAVGAGGPLYRMLETVRGYAALELAAAGERGDALEGLVRYSAAEAALAANGLLGLEQVDWLDRIRVDLENYRCVLAWLIERRRSAEAADIAWSLLFFWVIRGHAGEGLQWYEQILAMPSPSSSARAKALAGAAVMSYTQGELERARTGMTAALPLAREVGDTDVVAQSENMFGHIEHAVGNMDAARNWFSRSLAGFRATNTRWGIGHALTGLAWVALATGDSGEAEHLLDEAAAALHDAGPWFLQLGLYVRAILAVRRGDPDAAIAVGRQSLARIRELDDKFAFVYALVPLAAAAALKGNDEWAARILGARDAVTERTGATVVDRSVPDLRDHAEREVRARLGSERWAHAYAAGRRTTVDALLQDIDRLTAKR